MADRALFLLVFLLSAGLRQYLAYFERTARWVASSALPGDEGRGMRLLRPDWMEGVAWAAACTAAGSAFLGWHSLGWQGTALVAAWHLVLARAASVLGPLPAWRHCLDVADVALAACPFPPHVEGLRSSLRLMRQACEHGASRAEVLSDAEKARVWPAMGKAIPQMAVYERRTDRNIRVFRLRPTRSRDGAAARLRD